MSLDLSVVAANWQIVADRRARPTWWSRRSAIYVRRPACCASNHREALERAVLMAQGGEFAFVLYTTAAMRSAIIAAEQNAILTATVILSMVLTPFAVHRRCARCSRATSSRWTASRWRTGSTGSVLIIGFGRFGQIASQPLLARGIDVSIIDNDTDMIRGAAALRLQGLLWRRHAARHAAGGRSETGRCWC